MTDIKRLSLHGRLRMAAACPDINASLLAEAADAIKQHEAFRQEVSDAVENWWYKETPPLPFRHFIIAKPDPLVEVISSALREGSPFDEDGSHDYTAEAKVIAAALAARGGRIVWEGETQATTEAEPQEIKLSGFERKFL